jgi:hypothetical protein
MHEHLPACVHARAHTRVRACAFVNVCVWASLSHVIWVGWGGEGWGALSHEALDFILL